MMHRRSPEGHHEIAAPLAVVLAVVWCVGYGVFVARPLCREWFESGQRIKLLRSRDVRGGAWAGEVDTLVKQQLVLEQTHDSLRSQLTLEVDLPRVLEELSAVAGTTGVVITRIRQLKPLDVSADGKKPFPEGMVELPIVLDAKGGYHQIGRFLAMLETGQRHLSVQRLVIKSQGSQGKHDIRLVVSALVLKI